MIEPNLVLNMKKLFLLFAFLCLSLSVKAQRCAVLDFQVGNGVTAQDIEGISFAFRSNFRPEGYTILERPQINATIEDLGYEQTDMTHQQTLRVGRNLDASVIVVGTINKFMDEYAVDVRVVDVAKGTTLVTEGANFERASYLTAMKELSNRLSSRLLSAPVPYSSQLSVPSTSSSSPKERTDPYVLFGYLKVFPKDLGYFPSIPKTVIAQLNQSMTYGYGTWRLPTKEELSMMRDNNIVGQGDYMTIENKTGIVRLVTDKAKGEVLPIIPVGYVDLGLPSGLLWKETNENGVFTYKEAENQFGTKLPSKDEWEELKNQCQWSWTGTGYLVVGPNGDSIHLPAAGWYNYYGEKGTGTGPEGYYWAFNVFHIGDDKDFPVGFVFKANNVIYMKSFFQMMRFSVRLIRGKYSE